MLTEYQKNTIETVDNGDDFDWAKLGLLIAEGGLPRLKPITRESLNNHFCFVKYKNDDDPVNYQRRAYTRAPRRRLLIFIIIEGISL